MSIDRYYNEDYKNIAPSGDQLFHEQISGAGGCFPAGTLVRTSHGFTCIERILPDSLSISYDRHGILEFGKITELHIHTKEELLASPEVNSDIYFFRAGDIELFPKGITGNHAIYDNVTKEHREAHTFKIGEFLETSEGKLLEITDIVISPLTDQPDDFKVYNLTVYPQHTYLVGTTDTLIKVHNGGGGKGGANRAAQEQPNTLQSSAIAKVLEVVSHGEIQGIVGGAQGVYFDSTVVQNPDLTYNFPGIIIDSRNGLPVQNAIPGFTNISNTDILPGGTIVQSLPYRHQFLETNLDAAQVIIGLPEGLWYQDANTGDLNGYVLEFTIHVWNVDTNVFTLAYDFTFRDKATSPYEMAFRIKKPTGATYWGFQITRITVDDKTVNFKSTLNCPRVVKIIEQTLTYPKIAYVGTTIPAKSVGNQIPSRSFDVMGIKCLIPSNYNPILRTYTGYWNGSFATNTAWTDNPAWCLYDLITNTDYGVANFLGQAVSVDKWSFYAAAEYCDCASWNGITYTYNYVDDGKGGHEVRYTFNTVVQVQMDAWQLIFAFASNFGCIPVVANGVISLIQDRPKTPRKIFNNSNVINGLFTYAGTDASNRVTSVNVTFNNAADRYLPTTITESADAATQARYGLIVKDIVAYACTRESQARRLAKYQLRSALHQYDSVTFEVSLNIVDIQVGDVISILDNDYVSDTSQYLAGRCKLINGTTVVFDAPVNFTGGYTYTLGVMSADYTTLIETPIVNPSAESMHLSPLAAKNPVGTSYTGLAAQQLTTTDTVTAINAFPAGDYSNHEFMCYASGYFEPRPYLVSSIKEHEKGKYIINCVFYDQDKYNAVDYGIVVPDRSYSMAGAPVIPSGFVVTQGYYNDGIYRKTWIRLTWTSNTNNAYYTIQVRKNNETYSAPLIIHNNWYEWKDVLPGTYDFLIVAFTHYGKQSPSASFSYNYKLSTTSTLLPPLNARITGTAGTVFASPDFSMSWDFNTNNINNPAVTDLLRDYIVEVYSADGLTMFGSYQVPTNSVADKNGKLYADNSTIKATFNSLPRSFICKIYSRDIVGAISAPLTATFTNPAPTAITGGSVTGFGLNVFLTIPSSYLTGLTDHNGFIIAASLTTPFTPTKDKWVLKTTVGAAVQGITYTLPAAGTYYIQAAISDDYDNNNLNWSATYGITATGGAGIMVFPVPGVPTGVTATATHIIQPTGETLTKVSASWTPPVGSQVSTYTLAFLDFTLGETNYHFVDVSEPQYEIILNTNHTYYFKVRANYGDSHSAYTAVYSLATGIDTTPTAAPTGLTVSNGFNTVTLHWNNPADFDFNKTEVWYSATNDRTVAAKAAETPANSYVFPDLAPGLSGYFWIRSVDNAGNLSGWYPAGATAGILGTTSKVDSTALATAVNTDIASGVAANTGTVNTRNNAPPTNNPVPASITITDQPDGSRTIGVSWTYTQGALPAEGFLIIFREDTLTLSLSDHTIKLGASTLSHSVAGLPQSATYRIGIAAYRTSDAGLQVGAIQQPTVTPNWIVNGTTTTVSAVSINANGTLSGAGAGQVTSSGINAFSSNSANTISGTATLQTSGYGTGAGMAVHANGITATAGGVNTFTIDSAGNATFRGTITGGANINITGQANFGGSTLGNSGSYYAGTFNTSSASFGGVEVNSTSLAGIGLYARTSGNGSYSVYANDLSNSSTSTALYGISSGYGVVGNGGLGYGVYGTSGTSNKAVYANGSFGTSSTTLVTNLNADMVDGLHAAAFVQGAGHTTSIGGTSTGTATATFASTNKPGANSSNVWLTITIDGSTLYIPVWA